MLNWKEVDRKVADDGRVYVAYEFEGYEIEVCDCSWEAGNLKIRATALPGNDFLPSIYISSHYGQDFQEIQIQTTSYGPLSIEDTDKVIEGYQIAQMVAREIVDRFPQCFARPESSPAPKFGRADNFAIVDGPDPVDLNDPENAKTAVQWSLPSGFCKKAQSMFYKYFDGDAPIYEYKGRLVVTDESFWLTDFGDGSPESPLGFPRWDGESWNELECWLVAVYDEMVEDECWDPVTDSYIG